MSSEETNTMKGEVGDANLSQDESVVCTGKIQVFVEGRKYKTQYTKKFLERKTWKAPNPNEILSIIPGSVSSILVKKGELVKKGDRLMIYEAMKMQNVITAPFDAEIEMINVEKGDRLPKGALLILLKSIETSVKKSKKK